MQAAIFSGPHQLNVVDFHLPVTGSDELLLKVGACGICGTDFHIYNGEAPAKAPVIIGHEYVGEVVDCGKDVSGFKAGNRVAVNPNIHCGYCGFCREGRINLCKNLKALGVTLNGGFAQYSILPQGQAYLIPDSFPLEHAALAEPLSCCIHGIDQAEIKISDTVAIIGAGTIGLLMLQLAQLKGAKKIVILEHIKNKSFLASSLQADHVFNPSDDNFNEKFKSYFPSGVDVVIECAGNQQAAELSLKIIKKGGRIVIFGLSDPRAYLKIPLQSFFHKELTIKSSLLNPYTFQTAVDLLVNKKINVELLAPLVVQLDSFSLQSLFTGSKDNSVIKYMIKPNN